MSILLAETKQDGHQTNENSALPDLVTIILTPRSPHTARGRTARHIFETNAFHALHPSARGHVLKNALPAIATTDCTRCRDKWLNHTPIEMDVLAESDCANEDCDHQDRCPTITTHVCLECNTAHHGTPDPTHWEGPVAPCHVVDALAAADAIRDPMASADATGEWEQARKDGRA